MVLASLFVNYKSPQQTYRKSQIGLKSVQKKNVHKYLMPYILGIPLNNLQLLLGVRVVPVINLTLKVQEAKVAKMEGVVNQV